MLDVYSEPIHHHLLVAMHVQRLPFVTVHRHHCTCYSALHIKEEFATCKQGCMHHMCD
jgi:hypothetical protein